MEALTAKAALVDPATLGDDSAVTTVVPRADIEEALKEEGPSDFYLDVKRVREGEGEEERRITMSWEPADLERLLESTTSDQVAFGFKADELARMFDEPDVEAQGLRERVAVLTVAAATAAGASAGVANAMTMPPSDVGGGSGTAVPMLTDTTSSGPAQAAPETAPFLTDATSSGAAAEESSSQFVTDATSSGPGAPVEAASAGGTGFVTDATSSGPGATGAEVSGGGARFVTDTTSGGPVPTESAAATSGGGDSFFATSGGEAALAGGLLLLIVGAGFVARRGPEPKPA